MSIIDDDASDNRLAETAALGVLAGITARVDPAAVQIAYSLPVDAGGLFAIDPVTGVIRLAGALDFETATQHLVTVRATYLDFSAEEAEFAISVDDVSEAGVVRVGTPAGETIEGTSGADTLSGLAGNDRLFGYADADLLDGGDGADLLDGGSGADTIVGGGGMDRLVGGEGDDLLDGGAGADSMEGGEGADSFLIRGNQGLGDLFFGGAGVDRILVAAGSSTVILAGLEAGDIEIFDASGVAIRGTSAADVFDFSGFASVLGLSRVTGAGGDDTMRGGLEADVFDGGDGNDLLEGGSGADELIGRAGNDLLYGGAGNDRLDGLTGNDIYDGGDGDDLFLILGVEARGDVFFGGAGFDTLFVRTGRNPMTLTTLQTESVERFDGSNWRIAGTTSADVLDFTQFEEAVNVGMVEVYGGSDRVIGGGWNDSFFGGGGNDTLAGGGGSDSLTGGSGSDIFEFAASDAVGADRILDFDGSGNDFIRMQGFGFGGATSNAGRRAALEAATHFDANGALIDLDAVGGHGSIRLVGVASLDFVATEDFIFLV